MRRWVRRCCRSSAWFPARVAHRVVVVVVVVAVVLLTSQRTFYGPRERRMGLLGFLRLGVWISGLRAFKNGFMGNVLGEGFILGGVYVIGRGQQVKSFSDIIGHLNIVQLLISDTDICGRVMAN